MPLKAELMKCPFCGSPATSLAVDCHPIGFRYGAVCTGCGCTCDFRCKTEEEAAERWNTRPVSGGRIEGKPPVKAGRSMGDPGFPVRPPLMRHETNVEKSVRKMARDLLKRHPLRRGPYLLTDAALRRVAYSRARR